MAEAPTGNPAEIVFVQDDSPTVPAPPKSEAPPRRRTHPEWGPFIGSVKSELDVIFTELGRLTENGADIYPEPVDIFRTLLIPPSSIKVIIVGQDPYHTPKTACGLAFAVTPGQPIPPSLRKIAQKIKQEGFESKAPSSQGHDLTKWPSQGVFLINTALTVLRGEPESHLKLWMPFMVKLFSYLATLDNVVWIFWGEKAWAYSRYAALKTKLGQVLFIRGGHPSPRNMTGSFEAVDYFGPANQYLISKGRQPVDWTL